MVIIPDSIPDAPDLSPRVKARKGKHPLPQYEMAERVVEKPGYLESCWPLVAGLVIGFFSPSLHDLLANSDTWITRAVFPFVALAGSPELHLGPELSAMLPGIVLFGQFPFEGLLAMWALRRRFSLLGMLGLIFGLHVVAAMIAWLLSLNL